MSMLDNVRQSFLIFQDKYQWSPEETIENFLRILSDLGWDILDDYKGDEEDWEVRDKKAASIVLYGNV